MNILRRTSTVRLVIAVLVIAIVSGATAYAVSTRSGPKPPPRSLAGLLDSDADGEARGGVGGVLARAIAFGAGTPADPARVDEVSCFGVVLAPAPAASSGALD